MALHAPVRHAGPADHRLLRDVLFGIGLLAALLLVLLLAPMIRVSVEPAAAPADQQALPEFRAGERASWIESSTTEERSLIEFRASEREGR